MSAPIPAAEDDLIRRARLADPQALSLLYQHYAPIIYRYLCGRVQDEELARDLLSEVFVAMIEGIKDYEDRGRPFSAWLYRIAHARVVDVLRARRRRCQLPIEVLTDTDSGPEELVSEQDERKELAHSLGALCKNQRDVLQLRFFQELSVQEVASQLGRSAGAIKAIQHRGISTLKRMMNSGVGE